MWFHKRFFRPVFFAFAALVLRIFSLGKIYTQKKTLKKKDIEPITIRFKNVEITEVVFFYFLGIMSNNELTTYLLYPVKFKR